MESLRWSRFNLIARLVVGTSHQDRRHRLGVCFFLLHKRDWRLVLDLRVFFLKFDNSSRELGKLLVYGDKVMIEDHLPLFIRQLIDGQSKQGLNVVAAAFHFEFHIFRRKRIAIDSQILNRASIIKRTGTPLTNF